MITVMGFNGDYFYNPIDGILIAFLIIWAILWFRDDR